MLQELLKTKPYLLADGATGTNLFEMGLVAGETPELWNDTHPERIEKLHQSFVDAGADIILTNSFGGNRRRLMLHQLQDRAHELNAKAAQIARYAPDNSLIGVTSLNSNTVSLVSPDFRDQTAIKVGSQPMDMAFRGDELFVACQGDGSVHVIDIPARKVKQTFQAGTGCESLGFY